MEERLEAAGNGAEATENDDKGTSELGRDKEVGKQRTGSPIMYVSWRVAQTARSNTGSYFSLDCDFQLTVLIFWGWIFILISILHQLL